MPDKSSETSVHYRKKPTVVNTIVRYANMLTSEHG
jgi:hypothetical protein